MSSRSSTSTRAAEEVLPIRRLRPTKQPPHGPLLPRRGGRPKAAPSKDCAVEPSLPGKKYLNLTKVDGEVPGLGREDKLLLVCAKGKRAYLTQNRLKFCRSIVRALGRCRSLLLRTVLLMVLVASRHSARGSGGEGANQKNVPLEQVPLAGSLSLKGRQPEFYKYQSG